MPQGRIIKGVGGLYTVESENGDYFCSARGRFRLDGAKPLVGDFVNFDVTDEAAKAGYLMELLPRKNEIIRPRAANIDLVIIVFAAASPGINLELLDSFLLVAEFQKLEVLICINKADIGDAENIAVLSGVYKTAGYEVITLSAATGENISALKAAMAGRVSIIAGPSGVGKTSIINAVFPGYSLETGELSRKIERGKHTTRHAELFKLESGGYLADTPGFSSLSTDIIPFEELSSCFVEFKEHLGKCFYVNCRHITEPDCAIKNEIGKSIPLQRYERYVTLCKRREKA